MDQLIVSITEITLREVNYLYEINYVNQQNENYLRIPQCFMLLGSPSTNNTIEITRAIEVPLETNSNVNNDNFSPDIVSNFGVNLDTINTRLRLVSTTNATLKVFGLLITNDKYFNYNSVMETLFKNYSTMNWVFKYEPMLASNELHLECYIIDKLAHTNNIQLMRSDYQFEASKYDFKPEQMFKEDIHAQSFEDFSSDVSRFEQEDGEQEAFLLHLITYIDKMIQYIKNGGTNSEILKEISLLLSQVKKGPTDDINDELMKKESEIAMIDIACKQLEMTDSLDDL